MPGDRLLVEIDAEGNSAHWAWRVKKCGNGVLEESLSRETLVSEATTRSGRLLPGTNGHAIDRAPVRSQEAEVDLFILRLMDGSTPLYQVARKTAARFPEHVDFERALARVGNLLEYYGCRTSSEDKT